jgi:hypothetical protein
MAQAASLMTSLKKIVLYPDFGITSCRQNYRQSICPLLDNLKADAVTIQNIRQIGPAGSRPLEQFDSISDNVKHATLVLPSTAPFIGGGSSDQHPQWSPRDLAFSTRNLDSVRLIIGLNLNEALRIEAKLGRRVSICKSIPLQAFLASFLTAHSAKAAKVDIYLFYGIDFPKNHNLEEFRQQLAVKVEQQHGNFRALNNNLVDIQFQDIRCTISNIISLSLVFATKWEKSCFNGSRTCGTLAQWRMIGRRRLSKKEGSRMNR